MTLKPLRTLCKIGKNLNFCLIFWGVLFFSGLSAYEVRFQGLTDSTLLELVKSSSQLEKLKANTPVTATGLKRRAQGDLPNIIQALHSRAYYNAKVDFTIEEQGELVIISIDIGSIYPLVDFRIVYMQQGVPFPEFCDRISLQDLGIEIGAAALPETILNAEDTLLDILNTKGYAFAAIKKQEALANQKEQHVIIFLEVETGPLSYFGPLKIAGTARVLNEFFYKKLRWQEGDLYNPVKIAQTQEALELSGLFRSITITHAEGPVEGNFLPITIQVVEAKQRSVGFGVNYTTEFNLGPGITLEWEDRNVFGKGQKLSFRTDLWLHRQEGSISYVVPDFRQADQNLIWQMDYKHEKIEAFTDSTLSLSATIERKLSERLRISYGAMYKLIRSKHSDDNRTFDLIQAPLQLRWSNTDSLLDPKKGATIHLKLIPSVQVLPPQFAYAIGTFTGSHYYPLTQDLRTVLATKLTLGSIIGASKHDIPPPERFYAGSENTIRGYKYWTISPLNKHHKPIGGRSMLVYSLELRHKFSESWGGVAFFDMGNVYSNPLPNFKEPLRQALGLGIRYYTPIGPLRVDLAIPLNKRRHIDKAYQIYFSIGQAF